MGCIYEFEYADGSKEEIDSDFVCGYSLLPTIGLYNPGFKFYGTGCNLDLLLESLQDRKPIIISRTSGKYDLKKIINTENIKSIKPKN